MLLTTYRTPLELLPPHGVMVVVIDNEVATEELHIRDRVLPFNANIAMLVGHGVAGRLDLTVGANGARQRWPATNCVGIQPVPCRGSAFEVAVSHAR